MSADLDRCAAYVAARDALVAIHDASAAWPSTIAVEARRAAVTAVAITAEGLGHGATTAARRRCIREALASAIAVAATLDVARAAGVDDGSMTAAQHHTGRAVALLALLLHASANPAGS
jgi:hypothetical protein